jgi:uncharacterized protein YcgL (UPF0745 family)
MERLSVWIYKVSRCAEAYLYVPEGNNFWCVPIAIVVTEVAGMLGFATLSPTYVLLRPDFSLAPVARK